ncbi:MAG: hypothetical protein CMJ83_10550 [Planctomycetes bacterium]|nr:hypothetical protein [Planctomycetota bacterium]
MRSSILGCCCVVLLSTVSSFAQNGGGPDVARLEAMAARVIGPAGMSGRVAAVDATPDGKVIWVGAATGGVWKSTGGGARWTPVFDDQPVSSIGAVAIDPHTPDVVWVGTGEGNPRNSAGVGNGVYRTRDAGRTWDHLGLIGTEKITRVVLHPRNPEVAYVAALGSSWGENRERGVYRTRDGGRTWKQVLFVDAKTGAADLVMDPRNPDRLVCAMWEHRRLPWHFHSGGPGSGIWATRDGGETWQRRTSEDGLPKGELGRIGLGVAASSPNVVYALVEAERSALHRSNDGGETWKKVNDDRGVNPRPFYYADIRVDPTNENRVYRLASLLDVSHDGGRTFETVLPFARVHPDHHAMWISDNGQMLINGSDGGIAISRDRGGSWRFVENLPLAQFYHVATDDSVPFNVYGGLQDNGSWRGPSRVFENGGIRNHHWREVGFGDGFGTVPVRGQDALAFCMSQGGNLMRSAWRTGERRNVRPPTPAGVDLRFAWNAGIALDPRHDGTLYYGSQFVHRSTDLGDSWSIISTDLTTNDPAKLKQSESGGLTRDVTAAENHCCVLTIAPSSREERVIWTGSDDGQVNVTRDAGEQWTNVTSAIQGLPPQTWCPHVEASCHSDGRAYVVFDDHRRANHTTYVYVTEDHGTSWKSLANPPASTSVGRPWGFAHVIEEDPVDQNLLWLGTEFGLWVSFDRGGQWTKWTHGVPTAPVRAIHTHDRDHDLVVATHGRGAFVIDDIRPLRKLRDATDARIRLSPVPPAVQARIRQPDGTRFTGDAMFKAKNRPNGALISFFVGDDSDPKKDEKEKLKVRIRDGKDEQLREWSVDVDLGLNRVTWDLRRDGESKSDDTSSERRRGGNRLPVVPGTYTLELALGDFVVRGPVQVLPDPRVPHDAEARRQHAEALATVDGWNARLTKAVDTLKDAVADLDLALGLLKDPATDGLKALKKDVQRVRDTATSLRDEVSHSGERQGIFDRGASIRSKVGRARRRLGSTWGAPSASDRAVMKTSKAVFDGFLTRFEAFKKQELAPIRRRVHEARLPLIR